MAVIYTDVFKSVPRQIAQANKDELALKVRPKYWRGGSDLNLRSLESQLALTPSEEKREARYWRKKANVNKERARQRSARKKRRGY